MSSVIPVAGNLPTALNSFVGRRAETAEIRRLLAAGRLVTLTGAGGAGKTRLALTAAAASRKAFPDGVWLVELAAVRDPSTVPAATADALRLPDRTARPALDRLTHHLARHRALIVLDNCEHVIDASAGLAKTLLSACPELRVLATSRQTLGVTGENVFVVSPLSIPDEAVELLRQRATAIRPDFRLTDADRARATRLCAALDGLPLAIELAASRLRTLTVEQVVELLEDRFALLTGGCRSTSPRQRTLRGMIEWSYELCTPAERLLWNRLSVFAGGFGLDAAETVCTGDGIAAHEVLDLLDRLVAQSVVLTCERDGMPRYRLLETIRTYGRSRLAASGEERPLLRRHRDFFLALAERTAAAWLGPGQREALARMRTEHRNLLAALEFGGSGHASATGPVPAGPVQGGSVEGGPVQAGPAPGGPAPAPSANPAPYPSAPHANHPAGTQGIQDAQNALRLATALRFHWCADGFLSEGRRQFDRLLAAAPEPTPARAGALWAAAWVAILQGDFATADRRLDEAEELGERLGDPSVRPYVLGYRGASAAFQGRMAQAAPLYEAALAAHAAAGDGPQALLWLFQLVIAQVCLGNPRAAEESGRHAARLAEASGERLYGAYAQWALGYVLWTRGDLEEGTALTRAALETLRGFNDHAGTAVALQVFTWITASRGDHEQAARLLGAVRALTRDIDDGPVTELGGHRARCEDAVASALGAAGYERALAEGAGYDSPARAIALALDDTGRDALSRRGLDAIAPGPLSRTERHPLSRQERDAPTPSPLSRREREVAALVAQGMTNRQVAAALSLSPRTVDRHVENIRARLGFTCRAQIAAWWAESPARAGTATSSP
ncbi:LuxR family transcriptional regulator [Streptomyces sp. V2]|uniref:ATP-binding protein n=2 Tax=Streptomyces TaxID=1883 RepID=UPI000D66BFF3|nr:LuxR C-terminal-related transcriptional regulator [Streptomyces sp. V2]PWG12370.1 LuxR family transcriptional regulator [Streptomyces sp. V2]